MSQQSDPLSAGQQAHHIYHVAFLLRQRLIPDLVSDIMEQAEIYWTTTTQTGLQRDVIVRQSTSPKEILRSDAIASPARVQYPVRKVVFTVSSHDQGWADSSDQGSWTWFTARKVTPTEGVSSSVLEGSTSGQGNQEHRELYRNPVAQQRWVLHEITWRADSDDPGEAEWVSSLKVGDIVAVNAWARFPGWVNNIKQASIVVHTMAIA